MFGEDVYFDDLDLLVKLAEAELVKAGEAVKAEGWGWVETDFDGLDWQQAQEFGRTYLQQAEAAEGDAERCDELAEKVEYGEATNEEEAEFAALEARLDVETYTDEQMAHAGAFVSLSYHGKIEVQRGMVRPEDLSAAVEAGVCAKPHRSGASSAPKGPYSAALEGDLVQVRTCAVQTALLVKPELVLDLLTFALSRPVYSDALPVGVSSTDADNQPEKDDGLTVASV